MIHDSIYDSALKIIECCSPSQVVAIRNAQMLDENILKNLDIQDESVQRDLISKIWCDWNIVYRYERLEICHWLLRHHKSGEWCVLSWDFENPYLTLDRLSSDLFHTEYNPYCFYDWGNYNTSGRKQRLIDQTMIILTDTDLIRLLDRSIRVNGSIEELSKFSQEFYLKELLLTTNNSYFSTVLGLWWFLQKLEFQNPAYVFLKGVGAYDKTTVDIESAVKNWVSKKTKMGMASKIDELLHTRWPELAHNKPQSCFLCSLDTGDYHIFRRRLKDGLDARPFWDEGNNCLSQKGLEEAESEMEYVTSYWNDDEWLGINPSFLIDEVIAGKNFETIVKNNLFQWNKQRKIQIVDMSGETWELIIWLEEENLAETPQIGISIQNFKTIAGWDIWDANQKLTCLKNFFLNDFKRGNSTVVYAAISNWFTPEYFDAENLWKVENFLTKIGELDS